MQKKSFTTKTSGYTQKDQNEAEKALLEQYEESKRRGEADRLIRYQHNFNLELHDKQARLTKTLIIITAICTTIGTIISAIIGAVIGSLVTHWLQ